MNFERVSHYYLRFSFWLTLIFLAFMGVNVVLALVFGAREFQYWIQDRAVRRDIQSKREGQPQASPKRSDYAMKWIDLRSYEGAVADSVQNVLDDFFDYEKLGYRFSPYVHYSNVLFKSQTVNVVNNDKGFDHRVVAGAKKAGEGQVFLFGGSTTFGTHVADDWTFASFLQSQLPQFEFVNFGRPNYSWFQELVLFQRLVHAGFRPRLVVFMDGVNVFSPDGTPTWSDKMQNLWEEAQIMPSREIFPNQIPVFRLLNFFSLRIRERKFNDKMAVRMPAGQSSLSFKDSYLNTLDQMRAIGKQFGIKTLFVLQPNRVVDCDFGQYTRALEESYSRTIRNFYQSLEGYRAGDFVDFSQLCQKYGRERRAFVDDVHYSPQFNQLIARELKTTIESVVR